MVKSSKSLLEIVKELYDNVGEYTHGEIDFETFHKQARDTFCRMWYVQERLDQSDQVIVPDFNIEVVKECILGSYVGGFYQH